MSEEGVIIISAGSETIGRTLTCATFHLLENPEALHSLQKELFELMPEASVTPDLRDLEQLPFLVSGSTTAGVGSGLHTNEIVPQTAVIKESLRMACITASRLPIISPNAPLQYRDWLIPAGVITSFISSTLKLTSDLTECFAGTSRDDSTQDHD